MSNENISNSRRTPPQSVSPSPSIEKDRKNSPPMSKKPSQKSYHSISVESQAQPPTPPTRPMMTTIQRLVDEYQ